MFVLTWQVCFDARGATTCYDIDSKCNVEMAGMSVSVQDDCTKFNAVRAFAVMGTIFIVVAALACFLAFMWERLRDVVTVMAVLAGEASSSVLFPTVCSLMVTAFVYAVYVCDVQVSAALLPWLFTLTTPRLTTPTRSTPLFSSSWPGWLHSLVPSCTVLALEACHHTAHSKLNLLQGNFSCRQYLFPCVFLLLLVMYWLLYAPPMLVCESVICLATQNDDSTQTRRVALSTLVASCSN